MNAEGHRLLRRTAQRGRRSGRWLRSEEVSPPRGDFLHFLGTGGNPSGVIAQRPRTGGIWLNLAGTALALDPGPGAAYHAARAGLDSHALAAVLISHGHTDHHLGAGALIEGMCYGMSRRRGVLALPQAALAAGLVGPFHLGREPSRWYQGGPDVVTWRAGQTLAVLGVRVTPFAVHHGPENYGLKFEGGGLRIVYSSDATYVLDYLDEAGALRAVRGGEELLPPAKVRTVRGELTDALRGADLAILNVGFFWQFAHRHLTAVGAAELLRRSGVPRAILTHFDRSTAPDADAIAAYVAAESGARVWAAHDGLRLPIAGT